jgi:hypothetical protein
MSSKYQILLDAILEKDAASRISDKTKNVKGKSYYFIFFILTTK